MGHLFVTQGDLTRVWCDAWLLPTDQNLFISPYWLRPHVRTPLGERLAEAPFGQFRLHAETPDEYASEEMRTTPFPDWPGGDRSPRPWLTHVGGSRSRDPQWYVKAAVEFVRRAGADGATVTGRPKPLLALPLIGTGAGGQFHRKALMTKALLPRLRMLAEEEDVDIVLVTYDDEAFAAAQVERRNSRVQWTDELSQEHLSAGRALAAHAMSDDLVLFLGAGISMGAGLPSWQGLLANLAEKAEMSATEIRSLSRFPATDQARIVERALGGREALVDAIREEVDRDHYSISHTLAARLPVQTTVTLNYDRLFENAMVDQGHRVHVIPNHKKNEEGRVLLKLHGCISRTDDIVLTREDYLRYGDRRSALAGFVQALLITHHVLFIGFGLADDNFHRILDDVRKVLGDPDRAETGGAVGTVLTLVIDRLRDDLWADELDILPMSRREHADEAEAARRLEIFLDWVVFLTGQKPTYVMNGSYESLLTPAEAEFRDELLQLARDYRERLSGTLVLEEFKEFFKRLGAG